MPAPSLYPPARPQSIGEVLDRAFQIFRRTLPGCLPYGLLLVLAAQLGRVYQFSRGTSNGSGAGPVSLLCYLGGALLGVLLVSAVLLRQRALAAGESSSRARELGTALRRFPATLLLALIAALVVGLALVCVGLLVRASGTLPGGPPLSLVGSLALLLVLPTSVALVVAAVSATCGFLLPSLLLRPAGPLQAIGCTLQLLRGNWWRAMLIFAVTVFVMLAFYGAALLLSSVVMALLRLQDVAVDSAILAVILLAVSAVIVPFYSAVVLTTFGDLCARREGIDLERRIAAAAET